MPDLENAPLFKVVGRKKEEDGTGKTYRFSEADKDLWANLFEYKGSEEHVRLRFSIDKLGAGLDDIAIVYEEALNGDAWGRFIASLEAKPDERPAPEPNVTIPEVPSVALPAVRRSILRLIPHQMAALIAILAVVVGIASFVAWHAYGRASNRASIERMAFPLPDKPSIAVLPFANMSERPRPGVFL